MKFYSLLLLAFGLLFSFLPSTAEAQSVDTITIAREVDSLLFTATKLWKARNFQEGLPLAQLAADMSKVTWGENNARYAASLHRLASLFKGLLQYSKAEELYLQAIKIRRNVLGDEHPDYASSLNNLAILYIENADYGKAEPLLLKTKSIREEVLGKEHRDYTTCLSNLAVLYIAKGNYDKAEFLFTETRAIYKKQLGMQSPDYAISLTSLANLYTIIGNYGKAEPLFLEAVLIWGKILGTEDPDYAGSLNNLGYLYMLEGEYSKAEPLFLEAGSIWEKTLGKEHPNYASSLNNLAILSIMGNNDYAKAERLFLEVKDIWEKAMGKEHPNMAVSLNNLAYVYEAKGEHQKAAGYLLAANTINQKLQQKASAYSSELEMLQYGVMFKEQTSKLLSFNQFPLIDSLIIAAYENVLFQKNALLDAAADRERAMAQADSVTQHIHNDWKSCQVRLDKQYGLPIAGRDTALIAVLESKANECEKELVRRSPAFVESRKEIHWQQVRDRLLPNQMAIEFIAYRDDSTNASNYSIRYAALVLQAGSAAPAFVSLCTQKQLEAVIDTAPKSERAEVWDSYLQQVYTQFQPGKNSLYDLIWKPLETYIIPFHSDRHTDKVTIFYASDGLIHSLNLNAIRDPVGNYLGQRYQLIQLGSTRYIVHPTAYIPADNRIVLFGGVNYDIDSTKISDAYKSLSDKSTESTRSGGDLINEENNLRGSAWKSLPGSKTEVENIAAHCQKYGMQVEKFTGFNATEEAIKHLGTSNSPSPRILHLATHGFFFSDPKIGKRFTGLLSGEQVFRYNDDPMRRAGLVLAGANYAWCQDTIEKALRLILEDGILTAAEVKTLNLSNTELVVLSACNTGLGDVRGNEGVYGLQRAFKIAGAKFLIMSLWSVPDRTTQQFMDLFYTNWLDKGMDIPGSFRATQERMKKDYPSPFYWGAFILLH